MRAITFAVLMCAAIARAQTVPHEIAFSARVVDNGTPLTGTHTLVVRLFDGATAGTALWTETFTGLQVTDGIVNATLGKMTPLTQMLLERPALFAEVTVDATTLAPRTQLVSTPYAIRAATAERLGTNVAADFALATHSHGGTYLPVGATLACAGTDKVVGLAANGSVMCAADSTAALAGSGTATTAARSDHAHGTAYLPLGPTLACTGTQKVTGLNANGSVTCAADLDTDTNTTYSAGPGLSLAFNQFSVAYGASGTATTVARSDHVHAETCPSGFTSHINVDGAIALCSKRVAQAVTWNSAAVSCATAHNASKLCTYSELRIAVNVAPAQFLSAGFWLGDRVGDNLVLRVNGTNTLDFDEQVDLLNNPAGSGYYCCKSPT